VETHRPDCRRIGPRPVCVQVERTPSCTVQNHDRIGDVFKTRSGRGRAGSAAHWTGELRATSIHANAAGADKAGIVEEMWGAHG
jgi:hypothetical protein